MKLKQQILLSNIVMIFLSLLTSVALLLLMFTLFQSETDSNAKRQAVMREAGIDLDVLNKPLVEVGYRLVLENRNELSGISDIILTYGIFLLPIIIILIFCMIFTRSLVRRILRPLEALAEGARRINAGNLSIPIDCGGKNELAMVCAAFNQMQSGLQNEREKTLAFERARTDLVAGISHDLRTPLTSVKGYIKGVRDGVANTPEKREQYLTIAYQKACDMDVLLDKLFYFSKLESGGVPLNLELIDLGDFARIFASDLEGEFPPSEFGMIVDATSVSHPVNIDAAQMRRALRNLTENAIKYADKRPLALKISVRRERNMEHLTFSDNGQGVIDEHLPRLFERFWRGDESRGTGGDRSGLGLYIVKYIAETHGGTVTAENEGGLKITISLPCGKE